MPEILWHCLNSTFWHYIIRHIFNILVSCFSSLISITDPKFFKKTIICVGMWRCAKEEKKRKIESYYCQWGFSQTTLFSWKCKWKELYNFRTKFFMTFLMYVGIVSCWCLGIFFPTLLLYCSWHPDSNMHSGALYLLSMRMYAHILFSPTFERKRKISNMDLGALYIQVFLIFHIFKYIVVFLSAKKGILLPLLIIHVIHSMHHFKKIHLVCHRFDWFVCFDNENARYADIWKRII